MVRLVACWLVPLVLVQGFAVASQRVHHGGHVHEVPLGVDGHDAHGGEVHFHLAPGFHVHEADAAGVVQVYDDADEVDISQAIKQLLLDQPQVASEGLVVDLRPAVAGPFVSLTGPKVSFFGEPQERPPRENAR